MNKITKAVVEIGKRSAIKQTEWLCTFFMHQPKVPAKLLAMKNSKVSGQK